MLPLDMVDLLLCPAAPQGDCKLSSLFRVQRSHFIPPRLPFGDSYGNKKLHDVSLGQPLVRDGT